MLGAIIGDIVGNRWEFNPTRSAKGRLLPVGCKNDYEFEWISPANSFTD